MRNRHKRLHSKTITLRERKKLDEWIAEHVLELNFEYGVLLYLLKVGEVTERESIECFRNSINAYSRLLKQRIVEVYEHNK